jgi:hypothetical protein
MAGSLFACSSENNATVADNDKIQIVTTIFPEYDWVTNVLGENPANAERIARTRQRLAIAEELYKATHGGRRGKK